MLGGAAELQKLANLEARAVTGCFRTINQGALSTESGLRPAVAQLNNRQRRFGAPLLSLPQRNQSREVAGAPSAIGGRLETALKYAGRVKETVLRRKVQEQDLKVVIEEQKEAKTKVERERRGLTILTDGSSLESS